MGDFQKEFEAYGADFQVTMERFVGNETIYLKLLDMLFADTNLQQLGDALRAGDMESAFQAAHTLKGVVGNMGLTPLYNAVCVMVEPLRAKEEREDYPVLYQAVLEEFEKADAFRMRLKGGGSCGGA